MNYFCDLIEPIRHVARAPNLVDEGEPGERREPLEERVVKAKHVLKSYRPSSPNRSTIKSTRPDRWRCSPLHANNAGAFGRFGAAVLWATTS